MTINPPPSVSWIEPAMTLSEYLRPALAAVAVIALGGGWYWFEHRSRSEPTETPSKALVIVAKPTNACFSDLVRVTGFVVPRREAVAGVDTEGSRVAEGLVREGDMVTENQDLARLPPPPNAGTARSATLRAPAAGLITAVTTAVGAPASPQAGPMF